jgi:hypothetical protein
VLTVISGSLWDDLTAACLKVESEPELLYDRRFTANQFFLATSPLRLTSSNFICQLHTCGYSLYVTCYLTIGWICRLQLLLIFASAVILRSESRGTHKPYFSVSDKRLFQPGGPGSYIYIAEEQGGPVITPDTGFPFRCLLQHGRLRWRYLTPPPHRNL